MLLFSKVFLGGLFFVGGLVPHLLGFLLATGASLVSKPIRKEMSEEHLEFDDSVSEALTFGTAGAGLALLGTATTPTDAAAAVGALAGTLASANFQKQ